MSKKGTQKFEVPQAVMEKITESGWVYNSERAVSDNVESLYSAVPEVRDLPVPLQQKNHFMQISENATRMRGRPKSPAINPFDTYVSAAERITSSVATKKGSVGEEIYSDLKFGSSDQNPVHGLSPEHQKIFESEMERMNMLLGK